MVYTDGKHLASDSEQELHLFADQIGLSRYFFKRLKEHPHYLLPDREKTIKALSMGAKNVSTRQIITICQKNRRRYV